MEDTIKIDLDVADIEYLQELIRKDKKSEMDTLRKRQIDIQLDVMKTLAREYDEKQKKKNLTMNKVEK